MRQVPARLLAMRIRLRRPGAADPTVTTIRDRNQQKHLR